MAVLLGGVFGAIGKKLLFSMKAKSMIFTLTGIPSLCEVRQKKSCVQHRGPFFAGILTALLPCASSNSMWLLAVSSGSAVKGMLTMLF